MASALMEHSSGREEICLVHSKISKYHDLGEVGQRDGGLIGPAGQGGLLEGSDI